MDYREVFRGKVKDLNLKELWLYSKFGRKLEHLEPCDFSEDTTTNPEDDLEEYNEY